MNWLFSLLFIATITEISSFIEEHVQNYFSSEIVKQATEIWEKHMISHQNWLAMALKENYGFKGINVYIRRPANPLLVTKGYYHTDNQVHIVYHDMNLEEFPNLSDLTIHFPLISNVIKIEAAVSRMIIHTEYMQFRNTSNIIFDLKNQDPYANSPFLFEQAQTIGQLAITVEGCKLSGIGIIALTGRTVTLGNTVFRLHHCLYNFEIFTPGVPSPPVVADYLPYSNEGLNIEHLIARPLSAELTPMLQAALHSYINTSAIFMDTLPDIRLEQERVFEHTTNYVNNVVRNLNVLTIMKMGAIKMDDLLIHWNDSFEDGPVNSVLSLNEMVLTGLESVYSAHTGGPFKMTRLKVSEELRYGALQVRGSIDVQVGDTTRGMYEFAVEINDVEVDITANVQPVAPNSPPKSFQNIEVMGWRDFQFSSPGMEFSTGEALITGYLLSKIPVYLGKHMMELLPQAIIEADKEYQSLEGKSALQAEGYIEQGDISPGPAIGLDDGNINLDGSIFSEQEINDPDGDFDGTEGNFDDGQGNFDSGGNFDDAQGNIGPDDKYDETQENIDPSGNYDDTQGKVGPSGNYDDAQGNIGPDDKYDETQENIDPSGNYDDTQGKVGPSGNYDDAQGNISPGGSFEGGQGSVGRGGSFEDGERVDKPSSFYNKQGPGNMLGYMLKSQNSRRKKLHTRQHRRIKGKNQKSLRRNLNSPAIREAPRATKPAGNMTENEIDMHTQIKT